LDYYSVDDLLDKTSMMAHADIFLTVYSTMCVEASFQERPIISVCIDSDIGYPGKYWLPMSKIGIWPTHSRFRASGAGRVATNEMELCTAINDYYSTPQANLLAQKEFVKQECTYTDGSAGRRTGEFLLLLLEKRDGS
jgi:CDP-glycerol glycerophosphotransferase (TagB/SpsB family)